MAIVLTSPPITPIESTPAMSEINQQNQQTATRASTTELIPHLWIIDQVDTRFSLTTLTIGSQFKVVIWSTAAELTLHHRRVMQLCLGSTRINTMLGLRMGLLSTRESHIKRGAAHLITTGNLRLRLCVIWLLLLLCGFQSTAVTPHLTNTATKWILLDSRPTISELRVIGTIQIGLLNLLNTKMGLLDVQVRVLKSGTTLIVLISRVELDLKTSSISQAETVVF